MIWLMLILGGFLLGLIRFPRKISPFTDLIKGCLPTFLATLFVDISHPFFIFVVLAPVLGSLIARSSGVFVFAGILAALLFSWENPYLFFIFSLIYLILTTIIKVPSKNLRVLISLGILVGISIPLCVYSEEYTLFVSIISSSALVASRHLPVYPSLRPRKKKKTNRHKK